MSLYRFTRGASRPAGRRRIFIGGVNLTKFRNKTTPRPRYTLTEPFAYGAAALSFPQVHAAYEADQLGTGDLAWCREGAQVVLDRVYPDGTVKIDYVGQLARVNPSGRVLTLQAGGQFSGPASMRDEQNQMYRESADVGRWASRAAGTVGLAFEPWFGPVTGIRLTHAGGQSLLSWAQYLCAMSQDADGTQRTLMPTAWGSGTWQFLPKDTTTIHGTIYNDDTSAVLDVVRDIAEAPNVIYGTGITPAGERITNAKWPGVFAGPAPTYPIAGGSPFDEGTTDADTVNGDGIEVLYIKLREMGYLPFQIEFTGAYTADFTKAVRKLQRAVGLTVTGTMTVAAWKRLFNVDRTGYKINGGYIAPLAFDPRVEPYLRTSNGSVAGRNPLYDPTIPRVERTIDFGSGITKAAMIDYAQGILARSAAFKNWAGTLRLNGNGGFTGSHDAAQATVDALNANPDAIVSYEDIRPGQNYRFPLFDGGTVFHVSGVDVDDKGATLTIDTQFRDLVEVREIRARNADSRRDLRREWMAQNRSRKPSTGMVACDEGFGWLDRDRRLEGGRWNVIPVIGGQQGQVNEVNIRLVGPHAEFVVAVFSKEMTPAKLQRKIGNPMTTGGESVWETSDIVADWLADKTLLYAIGDGKQPCGYGHRRKRNDDGDLTGAPLNGWLIDTAPWPYIHAAHTAVIEYVAIRPDRDCTLKKGRILYPQLNDAAA